MANNLENIRPFRFIAQKILPLVYDESLSYYEFLCKVLAKLNETIGTVNNQNTVIDEFKTYVQNVLTAYIAQVNLQNEKIEDLENAWDEYKTQLNGEWEAYKRDTTSSFEQDIVAYWEDFRDNYAQTLGVVQSLGTSTTDVISQNKSTTLFEDTWNEMRYSTSKNVFDLNDQTYETMPGYQINADGSIGTGTNYKGTNLIKVKPNTSYWIGIIPSVNNSSKPWGAGTGANINPQVFEYSAKDYSSFIKYHTGNNGQLITTDYNTNYIAFNYVNDLTLKGFTSKCVVMEGATEEVTEYVGYGRYNNYVKLTDNSIKIEEVKENQKIKTYNIFNLEEQNEVSDYYYGTNGMPTETATYGCTDFIKVKPNMQYTIGLIPATGGTVKPWNSASVGYLQYQNNNSDNSGYLRVYGTDNTFKTHPNCHYIKFNFLKGNTPWATIKTRCVIVEGDTLPNAFIPSASSDINTLLENNNAFYNWRDNILQIGFNYSKEKIGFIQLNKTSVTTTNNLFDLQEIFTIPKFGKSGNKTTLMSTGSSDCFSPYKVSAINPINPGDSPVAVFTGGSHLYNGSSTAITDYINVFADGNKVENGESGFAKSVKVIWRNRVQGWNTVKLDGTGDYVISVYHSAEFIDGKLYVKTDIVPIVDVKMKLYYGFQGYVSSSNYPYVRFLSSENRLRNNSSSNPVSQDKYGYTIYATKGTADTDTDFMRIEIDPLFDMGHTRSSFNTVNDNAMFVSNNKCYFNIINSGTDSSDVTMNAGTLYSLKGYYEFGEVQSKLYN